MNSYIPAKPLRQISLPHHLRQISLPITWNV